MVDRKTIIEMIKTLEEQLPGCKSSYQRAKLRGMIGALTWVLED